MKKKEAEDKIKKMESLQVFDRDQDCDVSKQKSDYNDSTSNKETNTRSTLATSDTEQQQQQQQDLETKLNMSKNKANSLEFVDVPLAKIQLSPPDDNKPPTNVTPVFDVEHLATFSSSPRESSQVDVNNDFVEKEYLNHASDNNKDMDTKDVLGDESALKRLFELEKTSGIWTQHMQIELQNEHMIIRDQETGSVVEKYVKQLVTKPQALSHYKSEIYNNLLVFKIKCPFRENSQSVRSSGSSSSSGCSRASGKFEATTKIKNSKSTEVNIFQCNSHDAQHVVDAIRDWRLSATSREVSAKSELKIPMPAEQSAARVDSAGKNTLGAHSAAIETATKNPDSAQPKPIVQVASCTDNASNALLMDQTRQLNVNVKETVQVFNQIAAMYNNSNNMDTSTKPTTTTSKPSSPTNSQQQKRLTGSRTNSSDLVTNKDIAPTTKEKLCSTDGSQQNFKLESLSSSTTPQTEQKSYDKADETLNVVLETFNKDKDLASEDDGAKNSSLSSSSSNNKIAKDVPKDETKEPMAIVSSSSLSLSTTSTSTSGSSNVYNSSVGSSRCGQQVVFTNPSAAEVAAHHQTRRSLSSSNLKLPVQSGKLDFELKILAAHQQHRKFAVNDRHEQRLMHKQNNKHIDYYDDHDQQDNYTDDYIDGDVYDNAEWNNMTTTQQLQQANTTITNESYVSVLNHCFDDIEKFIMRLQQAVLAIRKISSSSSTSSSNSSSTCAKPFSNTSASSQVLSSLNVAAPKQQQQQHQQLQKSNSNSTASKASSSSISGSNLASTSAALAKANSTKVKIAHAEDFYEILSKFKLAFNLLAKLKGCIYEPNAPELVHFLFTPLAIVVDAARNEPVHVDATLVGVPYLNKDAIELLTNCCTSKESDLWLSLGPNWTQAVDANLLRNSRLPSSFQPIFTNNWAPIITDLDLIGLSMPPDTPIHHPASGISANHSQQTRIMHSLNYKQKQQPDRQMNHRNNYLTSNSRWQHNLAMDVNEPRKDRHLLMTAIESVTSSNQMLKTKEQFLNQKMRHSHQQQNFNSHIDTSSDYQSKNTLSHQNSYSLPSAQIELSTDSRHIGVNLYSSQERVAANHQQKNRQHPNNHKQWLQPVAPRRLQQVPNKHYATSAQHSLQLDADTTSVDSDYETILIDLGPVQADFLNMLQVRNARTVRVLFTRAANNCKELSVQKGEVLELLNDSRRWWLVRNIDQQVGHVPHTIVAEMRGYQTLDELLETSFNEISDDEIQQVQHKNLSQDSKSYQRQMPQPQSHIHKPQQVFHDSQRQMMLRNTSGSHNKPIALLQQKKSVPSHRNISTNKNNSLRYV